ncbi:MAG: NAD(P)/FAD-dependent oxidoreductase [Bacteroidales bacterium]|nr:NAD(P)/FAD-dependent oxidoreductase [Bacteroidales bacterium]
MEPISNIPSRHGKKRIVIIGGGFAGIILARKLNERKFQVVLVDRFNFHQFQPLFYQVATAGLAPSAISFPLRKVFHKKKDLHYRMCEATRIVPEKNILETTIGEVSYDYLVIASGCTTNFYGNEQLRENTYPLKSTAEALSMRNHILLSLENAISAPNERERRKYMNFVIVGGGATGVELSGALSEMRRYAFPKDYPELDFGKMKIYLVEAASGLLTAFPPDLSASVEKHLKKMDVELLLNAAVTAYEGDKLTLSTGQTIETSTVIWVAGVTGNKIEGLKEDDWFKGRIKVDGFNKVDGYDNIFAIGDIALMMNEEYPKGHPQVAQVAIQQATHLVKNLKAASEGKPFQPFIYKNKGSMATVGRNAAVVELGFLHLKGFPAWFLWCFVHLVTIMGMENKLNIFIHWMWSYFTNDQALRILVKPLCRKDGGYDITSGSPCNNRDTR